MEKGLTFKNHHVRSLIAMLNIPLHGQESRSRTRFLRLINPLAEDFETERKAKLAELAVKDKDGNPVVNPNGIYDLGENSDAFAEFFKELVNAEVTIDVLPSNKEDVAVVRNILMNLPTELGAGDAEELEQILEVFEGSAKTESPAKPKKSKK